MFSVKINLPIWIQFMIYRTTVHVAIETTFEKFIDNIVSIAYFEVMMLFGG